MINRVNMDGVTAYSEYTQLPKGGYVVKIMKAEVKNNRVGQYIELSCDICEGEYSGFYAADYRNQGDPKKWHCVSFINVPRDDGSEKDGWTKKSFKTWYDALEQSNPGYTFDWDDTKLKGLICGAVFAGEEYIGRDGSKKMAIKIRNWIPADNVRKGKYKIPEDKTVKSGGSAAPSSSSGSGFIPVSETDADLPF